MTITMLLWLLYEEQTRPFPISPSQKHSLLTDKGNVYFNYGKRVRLAHEHLPSYRTVPCEKSDM